MKRRTLLQTAAGTLLPGMIMKGGGYGLIGDIVLGIIGGIVGGFLGGLIFGVDMVNGINLTSLLVSILGAVLVVWLSRLIRGKR